MKARLFMALGLVVGLGAGACGDGNRPGALPDAYVPGVDDGDGDGIPDATDNCPAVANADQLDTDHDGKGDACDADDDNDGVADTADNCPLVANPDQLDTDRDGKGDACDADDDNDGVADTADNCPLVANPDQANADGDAQGDACDPDDDNDGVLDGADNCPLVANPDQANADGDAQGDACDDDDDGDGVPDATDDCRLVANPDQLDTDRDGMGDACDPDDDNDGVLDGADNCRLVANPDQADLDGDGIGNACDADRDGDGVGNAADNCPDTANPDQVNTDGDAQGDACDPDDDNDGVLDGADNCRLVANGDQSNLDGDAQGDACDPDDDNDGVLDGADNCPTVANANQLDTNGNGKGDLCDGVLVPVVSSFLPGGHIASAGAGFAARVDHVVDTQVTITLAGIPATGTVRRVFLYWAVIGQAFPALTLNGTAVTGTLIGQTGDTTWNIGNNFEYRADVTALVSGNGAYTLSNLLSSLTGPDGQGASLVAIYTDSADLRTNYIGINDGAAGVLKAGDISTSVTRGFTVGAGFDKATVINLVADGQQSPDNLTIQGTTFGGTDAFQGAQGSLWDNRVDDITTVLLPGATSVTQKVKASIDFLVWVASAVVIEDVNSSSLRRPGRIASPR
jgi:hypothetical protein